MFSRVYSSFIAVICAVSSCMVLANLMDAQTVNRVQPPSVPAQSTLVLTPTVYLPLLFSAYQFTPVVRITFDPANDTQPALSPDGQVILFISDRAGQADVFSISSTGGQVITLTQTISAQEDTPVFSPDGSKIAFASNRSGDWDIYLMDANGGNVQRTIGYTGTDELHPFFTPDGTSLLFSSNIGGNWDIYSATLGSEAVNWTRLTTDPATDRFPSISADGQTIAFRSERDGNSEIYMMSADGSRVRRITNDPAFDGYPSIVPDGSGVVFTSQRNGASQLYATNLSGGGLITLTAQSGWLADTPRLSRDSRRLIYAARSVTGTFDVYLQPFESPLTQIGTRGAISLTADRCDWEAGMLALGLAHAWQATGDVDELARLRTWINGCIPIKSGHIDQVNDGLLGYAALIAYQADHQPQQLAFAQQVADFMMNTAQRAPDGTLLHLQDQPLIWDDTLLSAVPFLIEMNKVSGNSRYLDEAIAQTIQHAAYLRDPSSGLYHHAAYMTGTLYAPTYWARGNGWALLADVELLSAMPITHPQRATVLDYFQQQAATLKLLQDATGLWHTVVNRPDFYLESSGSALIGYALRQGARAGWLDDAQFAPSAQVTLIGVWSVTASDGLVGEASGPTGPMVFEDWYNLIPKGKLELYGQGAALLLASPLVQ